jgi:hypothetical protein
MAPSTAALAILVPTALGAGAGLIIFGLLAAFTGLPKTSGGAAATMT